VQRFFFTSALVPDGAEGGEDNDKGSGEEEEEEEEEEEAVVLARQVCNLLFQFHLPSVQARKNRRTSLLSPSFVI
jgi:hypothetical protein